MVEPLRRIGSVLRGYLLHAVAIVGLFHVLLCYGFPFALIFAIWLGTSLWLLLIDSRSALLVVVSLGLATLAMSYALTVSGLGAALFYRPNELLSRADANFGRVYKPYAQISMRMPYGDIQAHTQVGVTEPREVTYQIDGLGFRNSADYHGQTEILVGDSFVEGVGDTQSCTISEQLKRYQRDSYNLGISGSDMNDYVNRVKAFRARYGTNFRVSLFVYEGNDFSSAYTGTPLNRSAFALRYYNFFKDFPLWKPTRILYLRAIKGHGRVKKGSAIVKDVGGKPMAFFERYVNETKNTQKRTNDDLHFREALEALKPNLAYVFFVPTKYRVYAQWVDASSLPDEQSRYLARMAAEAGVKFHDLTPALVHAAEKLLLIGDYVYWRDDSHWNCNGMRVAAEEVARVWGNRDD